MKYSCKTYIFKNYESRIHVQNMKHATQHQNKFFWKNRLEKALAKNLT